MQDRSHVESVIAERAFQLVYQPIVHLESGTVTGVEALCRFHDGRAPDVWFEECEALGLAPAMDLAIIGMAIDDLDDLPPGYLSLNLSPTTLTTPGALGHALRPALERGTVVLELTEHAMVEDYAVALDALGILRRAGVLLAIDDAGAGYSTFRHILRLGPDIIKLDRSITQRIDRDAGRQALASALVIFAAEINASVVAEGIETEQELVALRAAGVGRGQGYFLGRPGPLPVELPMYEPPPFYAVVDAALRQRLLHVDPDDSEATTAVVAHDALTSMSAIATAIGLLTTSDGLLPQEEFRALCTVIQRRSGHVTEILKSLARGTPLGVSATSEL